jgi:hypothetical protein
MALTEEQIRDCTSDEELFQALSAELHRRLPDGESDDLDLFVERLRALPKGLRAMAAIYQLDVSMALDDLGWHFANWHHRPYCDETLRGLQELETHEPAEIFSNAYELAQLYWSTIGELLAQGFDKFVDWYPDSELEKTLDPLNRRMWDPAALWADGLLVDLRAQVSREGSERVRHQPGQADVRGYSAASVRAFCFASRRASTGARKCPV